jgi:cellulose synthase (UDP-forming)
MKRMLVIITLVMLGLVLAIQPTVAQEVAPVVIPQDGTMVYGTYDTVGNLNSPDITAVNGFINWLNGYNSLTGAGAITNFLTSTRAQGKIPMITLETRSYEGYNGQTDETILEDIAIGLYDQEILLNCQAIAAFKPQQVLLRINQEADLIGQWIWATGNPAAYISAFRYIVLACRAVGADNILPVFSPSGGMGSADYYPGLRAGEVSPDGQDYVAYNGITVLEYLDYDLRHGSAARSFNDLAWEHYSWTQSFSKPVIIAELGVCCGAEYQAQWLRNAYYAMNNRTWYPNLRMVFYFNDMDPNASWGEGLTPDWRVCSSLYPYSSYEAASPESRTSICESEFTPLNP